MALPDRELENPTDPLDFEPSRVAAGKNRLTDDQLYTWYVELHEWVAEFRRAYAFWWEVFPSCWYKHRGLVELFALLRAAQQALVVKHGAPNVSQREALDWVVFVQTVSTAVYRVARMCHGGHKSYRRLHSLSDTNDDGEFETWLRWGVYGRESASKRAAEFE